MPGTLAPAAQVPTPAAITPAYVAPVASNGVPNPDGRVVVHIKIGATATTVTVVGQGRMGDVTVPNRVFAGLTNTERLIVLDAALYNAVDGQVQIDFSQVANVTWAIFKLP